MRRGEVFGDHLACHLALWGFSFPHIKCRLSFLTNCPRPLQATPFPHLFVKSSCPTGGAFPGIGDLVSSGWNLAIRKSPLDRASCSDTQMGTCVWASRGRPSWRMLSEVNTPLGMRSPWQDLCSLMSFHKCPKFKRKGKCQSLTGPRTGVTWGLRRARMDPSEPQASWTQGHTPLLEAA